MHRLRLMIVSLVEHADEVSEPPGHPPRVEAESLDVLLEGQPALHRRRRPLEAAELLQDQMGLLKNVFQAC